MAFIEVRDVTKTYKMGEVEIKAVDEIGFGIDKGEFVVIVGPSGAGKTTILNILGGMDTATSGTIYVDNVDITKFNENELTKYRRDDVGFVFQFYNLVGNLTAIENVELALQISKNPLSAKDVLKDVGLGNRLDNFPAQLSGGEQQMLAVGRALMAKPKMILMDEPSMGLSPLLVKEIFAIIQEVNKQGITILLVEQNAKMALAISDRAYVLETGNISIEGNAADLLNDPRVKKAYLGQ